MRIALLLVLLAACQSSDVSRTLGARCDRNADCAQKCLVPGMDWPGGFCTTVCQTDGDCGDGSHCIAESGGVCAFACSGDADCKFLGDTYRCEQVDAAGGPPQVKVCRGG